MRTVSMVKTIAVTALLIGSVVQGAPALEFQLYDTMGREVRAQDYKGRPIFLEFGACW